MNMAKITAMIRESIISEVNLCFLPEGFLRRQNRQLINFVSCQSAITISPNNSHWLPNQITQVIYAREIKVNLKKGFFKNLNDR